MEKQRDRETKKPDAVVVNHALLKPNDNVTKFRLSTGLRLVDEQTQQDLDIKTRLLKRLSEDGTNLENLFQNVNDIISMARTADEALQTVACRIGMIKDYLVSNGSDTNSNEEQEYVQNLASEVKKIVQETSFGGNNLLNGAFCFRTVKIGEDPKETMTFSMPDLRKLTEKLQKIDKSTNPEALTTVDCMLSQVNRERFKMAALLDRLINARYNQYQVIKHLGMGPSKSLWSPQQTQRETQSITI